MKDFEALRKQIEESIKGFAAALDGNAAVPRPNQKDDEDDK